MSQLQLSGPMQYGPGWTAPAGTYGPGSVVPGPNGKNMLIPGQQPAQQAPQPSAPAGPASFMGQRGPINNARDFMPKGARPGGGQTPQGPAYQAMMSQQQQGTMPNVPGFSSIGSQAMQVYNQQLQSFNQQYGNALQSMNAMLTNPNLIGSYGGGGVAQQ